MSACLQAMVQCCPAAVISRHPCHYLNLETFVTKFLQSNGPRARSLTIFINRQAPLYQPESRAPTQAVPRNKRSTPTQFSDYLQELAEKIKSMTRLSTFSFFVSSGACKFDFQIPRRSIATFLDCLPETCHSIEIDTQHLDRDMLDPSPVHLCDKVRALLPQLKHLRLDVRSMCQALFGIGPAPDSSPVKTFNYSPVDAPSLQTVFIKSTNTYRRTLVCGTSGKVPKNLAKKQHTLS